MQQECLSQTIMTSRRVFLTLLTTLLASCASLPGDSPVVEQLDDETGLTIARLGKPLELYRETFRKETAGKFAFLGPFETNQQGQRELYLWVALPLEDPAADVTPTYLVNGKPLSLGTPARDAESAGLRHPPYQIPTSWIAMYYYRIGPDVVTTLGEAGTIRIQTVETTNAGPLRTNYSFDVGDDPRLKAFAGR
jgi:hypothetical protein